MTSLTLFGGAENAGVENAEVENAGVDGRGGKCRIGKCGSRQQGWKMQPSPSSLCYVLVCPSISCTDMDVKKQQHKI